MAEPDHGTSSARAMPAAVDAAVGVAAAATNAAVSVTRLFARAAAPVGRLVMHPPLVNKSLHPARVVEAFADRGYLARTSANTDLNRIIAAVVPPVVEEVLDSLDLTALVQERVDIDALVSTVDIAAVVDRMDIDAIVRHVDVDGMLRQVDIDAIVSKVDIDAIVRQVDIDAIAKRIDVDAIVERIDVDAIVSRVDVDAIVRRLDLVALAEEVVNGIDLPEIIRESTGSMASDVVRDARMQSIEADETIARIVDRIIRRRRARLTDAPGEPESDMGVARPAPTEPAQTPPALPAQPEPPKELPPLPAQTEPPKELPPP
ncbi:MAG TPA: hypothetical protein VJ820_15120 [Propionibacteriaceae bacterium]|nr:hypothetical protein [Propionibacteriaceae bacterium]